MSKKVKLVKGNKTQCVSNKVMIETLISMGYHLTGGGTVSPKPEPSPTKTDNESTAKGAK